MRVLPTVYRGTEYRSRTEARWAVFYTHLGVRFQYEFEAIQFEDGTRYLPDFWLPDLQAFVEIKGAYPSWEEVRTGELLAGASGRRVYLFQGAPQEVSDSESGTIALFPLPGTDAVDRDDDYEWCECPRCGELSIQWGGKGDRVHPEGCLPRSHSSRLHHAYAAARAERFDWRVSA